MTDRDPMLLLPSLRAAEARVAALEAAISVEGIMAILAGARDATGCSACGGLMPKEEQVYLAKRLHASLLKAGSLKAGSQS